MVTEDRDGPNNTFTRIGEMSTKPIDDPVIKVIGPDGSSIEQTCWMLRNVDSKDRFNVLRGWLAKYVTPACRRRWGLGSYKLGKKIGDSYELIWTLGWCGGI